MIPQYIFIILGYFSGTIPFGFFFSHVFNLGNIREIGSGNIGATNVLRTGHKTAAFLTLISDFLKGYIPVLLYMDSYELLKEHFWQQPFIDQTCTFIALAAIIGHIFPIWLGFRGGKGVATAIGTYLALSPLSFLLGGIIWGIVFFMTKISSLSALISLCGVLPVFIGFMTLKQPLIRPLLLFSITIAVLLMITHLSNIKRLLEGNETRLKTRK